MPRLDPTKYVQKAVELARVAGEAGTFAVGGLLLDCEGNILREAHNNVVRNRQLSDPTAHGERQLISWYYQTLHRGKSLPPPSELTIVTSLDPCLMCTGAILQSGFNAIVIAHDDIGGINWNRENSFLTVPKPIRQTAVEQFAYFGVAGVSRPFVGSAKSIFANAVVPAKLVSESFELARASIENVRRLNRRKTSSPDGNVITHDSSSAQSPRTQSRSAVMPEFDITDAADRARLLDEMLKVAEASKTAGGYFDATALVDESKGVLLILGSSPLSESPIDTPLMRVVQAYSSCRLNDADRNSLPHPSQCSVVLLYGPAPTALGLMDLGVFGLSVGPSDVPQRLYYFRSLQSEQNLADMIQNLPPVFRDVMKIAPTKLKR